MTALNEWAKRWNIPAAALTELRELWGTVGSSIPAPPSNEQTEAGVMSRVKLEASQKGIRLWRNNNGAGKMENGNFVRFGLANESSAINEVIKSGDLIGIRPVLITRDLIGAIIGQFVSREIKPAAWKYCATEREQAQLAWAQLITSMGGDACFATQEGTL